MEIETTKRMWPGVRLVLPARTTALDAEARTMVSLSAYIGAFTIFSAALFVHAGYRVQGASILVDLMFVVASAAISLACLRASVLPQLARAMIACNQFAVICSAGIMLTYAAASVNNPFVDKALLRFDTAIGYDWLTYAEFVHDRLWVANLLYRAYMLIFPAPVIAIVCLTFSNRNRKINQFLLATMISLFFTAAIFALFPALTAWDYLGFTPGAIQRLGYLPDATAGWEHDLLEIRAGHGYDLKRLSSSGLIAFPSYHCVAGILFTWVLWPLKSTRLPVVTASFLLIAAAPIYGGHYMADLVGGAVVAILSINLACFLEKTLFGKARCVIVPV